MSETARERRVEEALAELAMVINRRLRARLEADSVDPAQIALLHTLKCHGSMRLGDIAEAMRLDASTVSRHVQHLGDRGLVDRDHDPDDGRVRIIGLSDAGAACLAESFEHRYALLTEALQGWNAPDRERLRDQLDSITAALRQPASRPEA